MVLVTVAALSGCPTPPQPEQEGDIELLSADDHLIRVAMALKGTRPSKAELDSVRADASAIDGIVDDYLDSPEFGATVRDMHGEQWLTNIDAIIFPAGFRPIGQLADLDAQALNTSVVESPGRFVEHVVMNDRPYHEIVTGDYAVADRVNATLFDLDFDAGGATWQETRFNDGRDHAGVLSDSFFFTRHSSTFSNKNRGRAAQVARAFLCYDFLDRQVELEAGIDLADEEAVQNAIQNNPTCVSCHQTLDPLAATFSSYFPIYVPGFLEAYPFDFYIGGAGAYMRSAPEGYFGEPSFGARDVGVLMASDPRFSMCTARRFKSYLMQQDQEAITVEELTHYNDVFLSEGMSAKAVVKALVLSDEFRAKASRVDDGAEEVRGVLKVRPEAMARLVESTTGYRWRTNLPFDFGGGNIGRLDLMTDAFFGFKVLMGGTDGQGVARPSTTTNATATLVLRGLAAHAAPHVVYADFNSNPPARRLFSDIEASERDESKVKAQLKTLELVLYGKSNDETIDAAYALFTESLAASDNGERAWEITLYAMLQDMRMATY
jgi:hypothetical protein